MQFSQEVFETINEWYGNRPQIQPPHVLDLLAPTDNNYIGYDNQTSEGEEDPSEPDTEDPMDFPVHRTIEGAADVTPPRSPQMASSTPSRGPVPSKFTTTLDSRPRPGLPLGITPQVISSSDTSSFSLKRRPGNTGVRRKSISGHTLVADATKATGALMTEQMKDIAECSRDLERSKIEVQLKLFSEQMEYQRQKDHRLYVNSLVANENVRLSILKQGEMVNCLAQLSTVLSKSLLMTNGQDSPSMPHAASKEDPTSHKYDCNAAPMSASSPTMFPQSDCHKVNNNLNG